MSFFFLLFRGSRGNTGRKLNLLAYFFITERKTAAPRNQAAFPTQEQRQPPPPATSHEKTRRGEMKLLLQQMTVRNWSRAAFSSTFPPPISCPLHPLPPSYNTEQYAAFSPLASKASTMLLCSQSCARAPCNHGRN